MLCAGIFRIGHDVLELSGLRRVLALELRHEQRPFSCARDDKRDRAFGRVKNEIGVVLDELVVEEYERGNLSVYIVKGSTCPFRTLFG